MRASNKQIMKPQIVEVIQQATYESIDTIQEFKLLKEIRLEIGYYGSDNKPLLTESIVINGTYFDLVMSESPDFAVGKPANEYREIDLWFVIDLMMNS